MTVSDEVLAVFASPGAAGHYGESVTTLEHMLQAAHFAQKEGAPKHLVIAALLHDIGHLLERVPDNIADWKTDARHEELGGRWLSRLFGPEVSDPVRLHVPAKRYLCATNPGYFERLSAASIQTLKLQGGPMTREEIAAFEREPHWREAVRVRLWDDEGKVAGLATPSLESYRPMIEATATARR